MNHNINWNEIEEETHCISCNEEGIYNVRCPDSRIPTSEPQSVRILFISEAPPLDIRNYFYYENSNDRLRRNLFELLNTDLGYEISSINDFIAEGFYLLPAVKCPSARNGRNIAPAKRVIKLCAEKHLKREIEYIRPEGVCLLGRTALYGFLILRNLWEEGSAELQGNIRLADVMGRILEVRIFDSYINFMISYWPTNRHGRFHEISEHIRILMEEIGFLTNHSP